MDNFNFKQYLFESRVGMYSRARLNENALMDSEALGMEIAKQHPELIDFKLNGETKKYQDAIFKYAGELLHSAGVSLQTVRGLAYDEDWAMELVSAVGDELEHGGGSLEEVNPDTLGAPQAAADAKMQQQDDENGDMVDNANMDVMAEDGESDRMPVSHEEFKRHVEGLMRAAKISLDKPAYYLGGSGMGFGEDFERVEEAREIIDIVLDEIDEHLNSVQDGETDLTSMKLNDPEECVGFYNRDFKPIIEKEGLVPKVQLEDSEVDYAWEVWQAKDFPNRVTGTDFSLNESYGNTIEAAYGNVGSVDKVAPAETGLSKYLDVLRAHDWFHHFSDDHRIWQRGQADKDNLKALYSTLASNDKQKAMDAFIDKYLQVYNPEKFPGAANNVKYLTTDTFKGAI